MSKEGVSKISGNASPKIGEATTYTVTDWYPATPQNQRNAAGVTWELFKKRSNGRFTTTNIKKTGSGTFTFGEVAQRNTYLLEAYLHESEGDGPSTIEINPQPVAIPRINKVELQYVDDSPGTVFSYTEKMRARAQCVNLTGQKLKFSLWEDDASGNGHNSNNLLIETKEANVDRSGVATAEFMLTRALMQKAMQGETDPQKLEFYVTVEYFSNRKHATDNVNVNNPSQTPVSRPQQPASNPTPTQQPAQPTSNNVPPRAPNSPAADKPQSQKEEKGIVDTVTSWWNNLDLWDWAESPGTIEPAQPPTPQPAAGRAVSVVQDSAVEDILDAYFAKKEFTKKTGEAAGTFEYKIGSNGNKTATDAEKDSIAKIILAKPAVKALADKKQYTTLEAIKQALTKNVYNKDEKVTFQTFKLGEELKKINSAPLDSKVYLVAKTSGLNGKQATIIIKEKDGLIKGSAGAILPVLEITEAQMEQATPAGTAVPGTEKTQFTGTIENGLVKVPIHLRPKSEDEFKQWREKVAKGKEDGEYTYKFGGENKVTDENSKKRVAETILKNAKSGNPANQKIVEGKTAFVDDIMKVLEIKNYQKDETIKFKLYKKQPELLYLQAKAQGEKQHDKEFLKADGAYFEIAKKCPRCEAKITVEEFREMFPDATQLFNKGTNSISPKTIEAFLDALNNTLKEFKINTCVKKAFFLAQITKETGTFSRVDENLYYTTEAALHSFWRRTTHPRLYSNPSEFYKDPEKLGNYVYRDVAENGDEASGDGYKFRGRGLIQITRKKGYRRFGEFAGKDLVTNPDLLLQDLDLMTRSAGWYWKHGVLLGNGSEKDLNTVAQTGNFTETTRLVHGSTDDVAARQTILNTIKKVLKTDECQLTDSDSDIEYHIQSSGEIQYKIINDKREYASYFYHDSSGNIHDLGKFKLTKVAENYGGLYKDKLGKDNANIYLIDIRTVKQSYKKDTLGFTLTINTSRYYMNDVTLAALYGAMLECGYGDFVFNGFSNEKGESVGGSKSHKNGMNGDLRYLRTDKKGGSTDLFNNGTDVGWKGLDESRQNSFNDALYKFGWKSMLSQSYGDKKEKLLNHATNDSDNNHNDHLHIQGFAPTLKEN